MTSPTGPPNRLAELLSALLDGRWTDEHRRQLAELLRDDPAARAFYLDYLFTHALLRRELGGRAALPGPAAYPGGNFDWSAVTADQPRNAAGRRGGRRLGLAVAAALLVAVGLTALALVQHWRAGPGQGPVAVADPPEGDAEPDDLPSPPEGAVAVLIDGPDAVWTPDTARPAAGGSFLLPGRLKLQAGVAEVAFLSGASVRLQGPAEFEPVAADRGFLHEGTLTARVPETAAGFTVGSRALTVKDLGTEFGMRVTPQGRAEVHVFEGEVEAAARDEGGHAQPARHLKEKDAVRTDAARPALAPTRYDERPFAPLRVDVRITDTFVRGGKYARQNFGAADRLEVKNERSPEYQREAYLLFDLSRVRSPVRVARVRLMPICAGPADLEHAAALVPNALRNEQNLTWATRPSAGAPFARWRVRPGQAVEFDVTELVRQAQAGNGMLGLRIYSTRDVGASGWAQYGSREGKVAARPQLLLTPGP